MQHEIRISLDGKTMLCRALPPLDDSDPFSLEWEIKDPFTPEEIESIGSALADAAAALLGVSISNEEEDIEQRINSDADDHPPAPAV